MAASESISAFPNIIIFSPSRTVLYPSHLQTSWFDIQSHLPESGFSGDNWEEMKAKIDYIVGGDEIECVLGYEIASISTV